MSENTDRYDARKLTKERTKDLLKEYVISGFIEIGMEKLPFEQIVKNIITALKSGSLSKYDLAE